MDIVDRYSGEKCRGSLQYPHESHDTILYILICTDRQTGGQHYELWCESCRTGPLLSITWNHETYIFEWVPQGGTPKNQFLKL
jgi:hypothetical protein